MFINTYVTFVLHLWQLHTINLHMMIMILMMIMKYRINHARLIEFTVINKNYQCKCKCRFQFI